MEDEFKTSMLLESFWDNYRKTNPEHVIFSLRRGTVAWFGKFILFGVGERCVYLFLVSCVL